MAFLTKRNSFFSYESDDITSAPSEDVESEVRQEVELENQIDNEVATVEEEGEVIEALAEQAVDNADLIENHPEAVTEEIVQESNKQYLLALGRLGLGSEDLRYVRLGFESSNTPLQNLRINQESVMDNIKKFFVKIWEWIKFFGRKIKDFFVNIGNGFKRLGGKLKSNKTSKEIQEALDNMKDEDINVNVNGIKSFAGFLDYIKVQPKNVTITELANTFLPITTFTMDKLSDIKNLRNMTSIVKNVTSIVKAANSITDGKFFIGINTSGNNGEIVFVSSSQDVDEVSETTNAYRKEYGSSYENTMTFDIVSIPEVSEDVVKNCVKEFINTESKLKALEKHLNTTIVSLQKKSSDTISKCFDQFEKLIKETEKKINAESSADDIKAVQSDIKVINAVKTMLNEFRKSHSYLLLILNAFVNNATKYLK